MKNEAGLRAIRSFFLQLASGCAVAAFALGILTPMATGKDHLDHHVTVIGLIFAGVFLFLGHQFAKAAQEAGRKE